MAETRSIVRRQRKKAVFQMKKLLVILGTRPEVIKLAPVVLGFRQYDSDFDVDVCFTGQHSTLATDLLAFFNITPTYTIDLMKPGQSLSYLTSEGLTRIAPVMERSRPDLLLVQGDTATAFFSTLAAFYQKIPVGHVEAGLRTEDRYAPFPEEIYRRLIGQLATYHFAPTRRAQQNLRREGITRHVNVVGNTVVDALQYSQAQIELGACERVHQLQSLVDPEKRLLLMTIHRRETIGQQLVQVCDAVRQLIKSNRDIHVLLPVHPNPDIRETVYSVLGDTENVRLIEPVSYPEMVWLMKRAFLILTDSGGIQEEAPYLGTPVLILRNQTDRMESVEAGAAIQVGTDKGKIIETATHVLNNEQVYRSMAIPKSPFGDGKATERIIRILLEDREDGS